MRVNGNVGVFKDKNGISVMNTVHETIETIRFRKRACAFTLIEMMITIALIALLISILVVTGSRVRRIADNKQTTQVMVTIKTGLEQFHDTYGYYPPLLDDRQSPINKFLSVVSDPDELKKKEVNYYSTLTLAPYLIGVGDINHDGNPDTDGQNADEFDDGLAGEGFRDPGRDHAWGGATSSNNRKQYWQTYENADPDGKLHGRVTKRLVDLNDSLKRAVDREGNPINGYYLFELTDVWERPIRYYRGWDSRETDVDKTDGLPIDWPREWFASVSTEDHESFVSQLRSAPFVLMSSGRDRLATPETLDGDDATADNDLDNILEIGE